MIEILKRGRRRASRLSSAGREASSIAQLLSGICVVLALICLALALGYRQKARQVACYAEAAELGLMPPGDCRDRK